MHQPQDRLLHRDTQSLFLCGSHHSAADEIRLCFSAVLYVRIDAGIAIRCISQMFTDPENLFFRCKYCSFSRRSRTYFTNQILADRPCVGIFRDIALRNLQDAGEYAG